MRRSHLPRAELPTSRTLVAFSIDVLLLILTDTSLHPSTCGGSSIHRDDGRDKSAPTSVQMNWLFCIIGHPAVGGFVAGMAFKLPASVQTKSPPPGPRACGSPTSEGGVN